MNLTIGADPELFLKNQAGKFISAIGKFGGTKENPRPLTHLGKGFAVQEDNVAVEFNIPPISLANGDLFANTIQMAVKDIEAEAKGKSLELAIVASAEFENDQLRHPRARVFGCDPDFNAWTLKPNPRPTSKNKKLRSAGGHIHIGGEDLDKIGIVRALDLFVGCPSIVFDADMARRELYGKAGAMRDKSYGVEYRTLSNFWIKDTQMSKMVHEQVVQAIAFVRDGRLIPNDVAVKVIKCINNSDKDLLRELTETYGLKY